MTRRRPISRCAPDSRGGVLLTALIFAAAIAVALPTFLAMSRASLKFSHRSFYHIAATDLAETGLEQAMWALNASAAGEAAAWTGWDTATAPGSARRKFSGFAYTGGATGEVSVVVEGYQAPGASALARAVVSIDGDQRVEKWMRVTTAGRSLFPFGLLLKEGLTASGGAYFDSWISDPDSNPATPAVAYAAGVARGNALIATTSTAMPAITLGSADIYGKVSVGAATNAGLAMSWGGQVGPRGMAISGSYNVAAGALSTGFTATFETITAPSGATARPSYTLPYSYDNPLTPWNDNIYVSGQDWDNPIAPKPVLGSPGQKTVIQMDKVTVKANARLKIEGDVVLVLPPSGQNTLEIVEGGSLVLATGATLTVYTPGNIAVTGGASAGVLNNSSPAAFQIWSTRPAGSIGQQITLQGSGSLSGVIYAPDAELKVPGGTHLAGAAVVRVATFSGSGAFHHDESLKNVSAGASASVRVDEYRELDTPAARAPHAAALDF